MFKINQGYGRFLVNEKLIAAFSLLKHYLMYIYNITYKYYMYCTCCKVDVRVLKNNIQ